jgi:ribosomal protein S7
MEAPGSAAEHPPGDSRSVVTQQIQSRDPAQITAAESQIRLRIARGKIYKELRTDWLPALAAQGRNADVADIALAAMPCAPDTKTMSSLLEQRMNALLALGKNQEALAAAKSLYNVCDFAKTEHVIDIVGICLIKCNPGDPGIAVNFRLAQTQLSRRPSHAGGIASSQPNAQALANLPSLSSIQVDSSIYSKQLDALKVNGDFNHRLIFGNMLLVTDKGQEAEQIFRDLLNSAKDETEKSLAIEAVGRALRTEDGNVGRANEWIASHQN